jgi:hypothetical protein
VRRDYSLKNFPSICRKNNGYHITWSWTLKWLIYPSISFHKYNSKNIFNVKLINDF